MEWMPHVDTLVLEALYNHTPPSCIQANILARTRITSPTYNIIIDLLLLRYIQKSRTVILRVTKTLVVYRLGNNTEWVQFLSNETSWHHESITNLLITMLKKDREAEENMPELINHCQDGTADEKSTSVIEVF